jgi:UDP-N-acetylmuramate--alanine ligase
MNIYFSGIGGSGLSPLSQICLDIGYQVQGSDIAPSLTTQEIESRGVSINYTQNRHKIQKIHQNTPIDWLVYTAGLKQDHPELVFARDKGIKITKRDQLLNFILKSKNLKLVAISGTHGKTTTTAMLVWLAKNLKLEISYLVGTNLSFGPAARYHPQSKFLVYEADEFDKNMLNFDPYISIIPSLDYDHPDTYPTPESYTQSFAKFVKQSQKTFIWQEDYQKIKPYLDAPTNQSTDPNIQQNIQALNLAKSESVLKHMKLKGLQNRQNGLLAIQAFSQIMEDSVDSNTSGNLGYSTSDKIKSLVLCLDKYPGSQRRMERLSTNLFSDYGHHPVEIQATLKNALEINPEVILVYQPHQNTRQVELHKNKAYKNCFRGAKKVYWLPTFLTRENPNLKIIAPRELTANVGIDKLELCDMNAELAQKIRQHLQKKQLVLVMGAGTIDTWARKSLY